MTLWLASVLSWFVTMNLYGGDHEIEGTMVTQYMQRHFDRSGLLKDNNPTSYVLVLLVAIDVVVVVVVVVVLLVWCIYPPFIYKGNPRISYNYSPTRTLSLVFPNYKI
jgi:hypothetical protein